MHRPIYCIIYFDRKDALTYKRKVLKFSNGDYSKLRRLVSAFDWNSCFHIDIDIYAANLTDAVMSWFHNTKGYLYANRFNSLFFSGQKNNKWHGIPPLLFNGNIHETNHAI